MSDSLTCTIAQAAVLMKCSRRHARRVLRERHEQDPRLRVLTRPTGAPEGNIAVNLMALAEILHGRSTEIDEAVGRIGYLESDVSSLQARIGRIEKIVIPHVSCRQRSIQP
jgi:hypothetical protein